VGALLSQHCAAPLAMQSGAAGKMEDEMASLSYDA